MAHTNMSLHPQVSPHSLDISQPQHTRYLGNNMEILLSSTNSSNSMLNDIFLQWQLLFSPLLLLLINI